MANSKATKKALFMSMLSLLLCFTMLMGATFAWFTDTVTSTGNRIIAGNLDVDLVMYDKETEEYVSIADGNGDIFSEAEGGNGINWEPGKTEIVYLGVRNLGSLALKYNVIVEVIDGLPGLVGSLEYALLDTVEYGQLDKVNNWNDIINYTGVQKADLEETTYEATNGVLDEVVTNPDVEETDYFALAVHMKEEAGNIYQNGKVTINVKVLATQKDAEADSFDETYDKEATLPDISSVTTDGTAEAELFAGDVTVTIPAEADAGDYKLVVSNKSVVTNGDATTASYDITLYKDGIKVEGNIPYPVEIKVGTMLDITALTHNGSPVAGYSYDAMSGIISFETMSFSPFAITYKNVPGEDIIVNDGKITAGVFYGINPASLDESLDDENSEYIAVSYTVDDETRYVVNERATTVVLVPDSSYTPVNTNYDVVTNVSGKLYSKISELQKNEFNTVYLMPGTYNEATTINVYSSMDIIGLGEKDSVRVVKVSGSDSNRHLFNCNGTKADYINVTLKNLYLDATANTTGGKDNAAVQCIRKTKVKCYDLTVQKGTGWSAIAFYVNGNNAVDGVKYPAYMYAENCTLSAANTFGILTTSGTYKFYHNNLTYGGNAYTNNSGSTKNTTMAPDDWEW